MLPSSPDLTEQVYLKNPFGRGHVYRTGDLVRRLDGGRGPYHFVRRIDNQVMRRLLSHASPSRLSLAPLPCLSPDNQVKVDGFRIELSEIEYVFASHPLVHQVGVSLIRTHTHAHAVPTPLSPLSSPHAHTPGPRLFVRCASAWCC